ncbi:MAG: hypothetical protein EXR79_07430 [Myxococcales bacterium]|nr:hypothetical protein [Myxococcales bacterium]
MHEDGCSRTRRGRATVVLRRSVAAMALRRSVAAAALGCTLAAIAIACGESPAAGTYFKASDVALADAANVDGSPSADGAARGDGAVLGDGSVAPDAAVAPDAGPVDLGAPPLPAGVVFATVTPPAPAAPALRVTTYNVMCSFCVNSSHKDWQQKWSERLPWLLEILARENPDVAGLQELSDNEASGKEIADLTATAGVYGAVSYKHKADDDLEIDYPDAAILYRKSRFALLESGQFWLSPQPDKAFSIGFAKSGAQFPRLVVWALLDDKVAKRKFYFATTHFDNNPPSQELSAPLALDRLHPLAQKHPLVFVGDYNAKPDNKAYAILTGKEGGKPWKFQNVVDLATVRAVESNVAAPPAAPFAFADRIDHIFVAGATFSVGRWAIDWFVYGAKNQFPSDHESIYADVDWVP